MEAPYTIASLPKPLDQQNGRILATAVYGFRGSTKGKRHETVVSVDGESVGIYNVQSQTLVTSYALPPQTYVCCRPCSIFCRATTSTTAQRRTYVAVKDGGKSSERKLVRFVERVGGGKSSGAEILASTKEECSIPDGDICSVDAVPSSTEALPSIVLAYKDGRIVSAPGDLSKTREERPPLKKKKSSAEVEFSSIIDTQSARKGILKGRDYVLAVLDQSTPVNTNASLLCQVVRTDTERRMEICTLRAYDQDDLGTSRPAVQPLMHHVLSASQKHVLEPAHFELHAASARLYQLGSGRLTVYDLGTTIPKRLSTFGSKAHPISSFVRLSASVVMATSHGTATLYETTYGSTQASVPINDKTTTTTSLKKVKRDSSIVDDTLDVHYDVVSVFSELGLVVVLRSNQFMALQLTDDVRSQIHGKARVTRLADVMGQSGQRQIKNYAKADHKAEKLARWTDKVDELIESNDVEALESLIANDQYLGRQRSSEKRHPKRTFSDDEDTNGDAAAYDDLWPLPEPLDPTHLEYQRISYVASKTFAYAPEGDELEVRISSRKLLEWLALAGYLNRSSLQKAVGVINGRQVIRPGDLMAAIFDIDEDFQLINGLLSLPTDWELSEIVQALCLLIRSFDVSNDEDHPPLALPAPPQVNGTSTNGDIEMVNGDAEMADDESESQLDLESKAAEGELEHVMRILQTGLEVRSNTLRVILERLHAFPSQDVTKKMREMMSHQELIFFIHVLRIELAGGGWTSRYVDAGADEDDEAAADADAPTSGMVDVIPSDGPSGPSDYAILAIGNLLNSAVDAIGTTGWLVGLSGAAQGTEELLDSLRAEVSAGLEACYEAHTLETSLAELEACTTTKYTPSSVMPDDDRMLPVGGRANSAGLKSKKSKAKKKHVLAIEKSKRVGKYSFDRIRF